jgi:hypothetical protein
MPCFWATRIAMRNWRAVSPSALMASMSLVSPGGSAGGVAVSPDVSSLEEGGFAVDEPLSSAGGV